MKKIISILLSVLMIFSLVSVGASAADDGFNITVATDLHYSQSGANSKPGQFTDRDYSHVVTSGEMRIEAAAIIDAFLQSAAKNESDIVLLAGDLTDTGSKKEHDFVSEVLARFEKETGKQVYVVPGNHDYAKKNGPAEFKDFYKDFGYNEAIALDPLSASYVADVGDEYRLIAIDSCEHQKGAHGMTAERVEWIRAQAEKAKADGKKTIAMMHHNLLKHFVLGDILHKGGYIETSYGLAEIFAEYNIRYTFTGHTHSHDINSYTGKNGVTVYDVLTSTINAYPCPYREVAFRSDSVSIKTSNITSIDTSCLKGIVTDACYNLATEDFVKYSETCAGYGFNDVADSYLSAEQIKSIMGLTQEEDAEMCSLIDEFMPKVREMFFMPLYASDETESGKSLQSYGKKLGIPLLETEYTTLAELIIALYKAYVVGSESYGILSDEYRLFTSAVTICLNQLLKDVKAEEYALLMSFICNFFGVNRLPSFFLSYAADGVSRAKGIDILVSSIISVGILGFTTDEAPDDNFATLPGYNEVPVAEEELTFFDKFVAFFLSIFDFILRFFGVGLI